MPRDVVSSTHMTVGQRESGRRWSSGKKMGLILPSGKAKLLEVTIDNAFKFDTHVHEIYKKTN